MDADTSATVKAALASQYLGALATLREVVERYPADLWVARGGGPAPWQIAYHALFFTHLYLQPSESEVRRWPGFREDYHLLGPPPWEPGYVPKIGEPYTQAEILEYAAFCEAEVRERMPAIDLLSESGFGWIPLSKLEHQIYTIRHLENHTGAIAAVLDAAGVKTIWHGRAPAAP